MSKIANQGASGNIKASKFNASGAAKSASKGGSFLSRAFSSVKGTASKGMGMLSGGASAVGKSMGKLNPMNTLQKLFKSPLAKGFGKVFGPVLSIAEGIGNVSSSISNAKTAKMAGENVDLGALG